MVCPLCRAPWQPQDAETCGPCGAYVPGGPAEIPDPDGAAESEAYQRGLAEGRRLKLEAHRHCVAIASPTCLYLGDGTKVTIDRDPKCVHRVALKHGPQDVVSLATADTEPAPANPDAAGAVVSLIRALYLYQGEELSGSGDPDLLEPHHAYACILDAIRKLDPEAAKVIAASPDGAEDLYSQRCRESVDV